MGESGWGRGGWRLRGVGMFSSMLAFREEPHLVTQKFLFRSSRYTPTLASCAEARRTKEFGDRSPGRIVGRSHPPQLPSPTPNKAPFWVQDTLPARRSRPLGHRIPRWARLVWIPLPGTQKVVAPGWLTPLTHRVRGEWGKRGKCKRRLGQRELTDKIKNK